MLFKYMGLFDSENLWIHPERIEPTYELIHNLKNDIYLEEDGVPVILKKEKQQFSKQELCTKV